MRYTLILAAMVLLFFRFTSAQAGPRGDPVVEFLDAIDSQISRIAAVGNLYLDGDQAEKLAMENLHNSTEILIKKLGKNPLKDLDVTLIQDAAKQLGSAAAEILRLKTTDTRRRDKVMLKLQKAHRIFETFPVMIWLRARYEILKGEEWLRREKYNSAETAFNNANDALERLQKGEKSRSDMASTAKNVRSFLEDCLIYVRRAEPMPADKFSKTRDALTKSYESLFENVRDTLK